MIDVVGRLDETQELGIGACAGCGREGQKKPAECRNRNITRLVCRRHRTAAAIDDGCVKDAAVLCAPGVSSGGAHLRTPRPRAQKNYFGLVDALPTGPYPAGAGPRPPVPPPS